SPAAWEGRDLKYLAYLTRVGLRAILNIAFNPGPIPVALIGTIPVQRPAESEERALHPRRAPRDELALPRGDGGPRARERVERARHPAGGGGPALGYVGPQARPARDARDLRRGEGPRGRPRGARGGNGGRHALAAPPTMSRGAHARKGGRPDLAADARRVRARRRRRRCARR